MLTIKQKEMLMELIKDGIMTFEVFLMVLMQIYSQH